MNFLSRVFGKNFEESIEDQVKYAIDNNKINKLKDLIYENRIDINKLSEVIQF